MTTPTQTRDSFIFYRSFYETISDLDDKQQLQIYKAIAELSLNDNLIVLEGISKTIFRLIEPQLKANKKRYLNGLKGAEHGSKGGRPKIENNPKITPKKPQDNPKITPNLTPNKNVNVNVNVNEECKSELINHNQNINVDFQEFWEYYTPIECNGRMVSKDNKKLAEEKYKKIRNSYSKELILDKLKKYLTYCKQNSILTKAVHRWLSSTDFNDNEECTSIVANTIATKQDLQKSQDAEIYKNFMERTSNSNYINHFKE